MRYERCGAAVRRSWIKRRAARGEPHLCRRVLVALDLSQRLSSSLKNKLGRVVAEEALAHVDDGLDGRGERGFVDDGPGRRSVGGLLERVVGLRGG